MSPPPRRPSLTLSGRQVIGWEAGSGAFAPATVTRMGRDRSFGLGRALGRDRARSSGSAGGVATRILKIVRIMQSKNP